MSPIRSTFGRSVGHLIKNFRDRDLTLNSTIVTDNRIKFSATGGNTVSTPGDGYKYHIFTSPGTFTITLGTRDLEIVAYGAGGGGGGKDGGNPGGGGGGGGCAYATISLPPGSYTVAIGGGGGKGVSDTNGGGGSAGSNGGGTGGGSGPGGTSGAGGGGGGWSGIYSGPIYYVVGAGGGGGGGGGIGASGPNTLPATGGGYNVRPTGSTNGGGGAPFPGDGGGAGGGGGGYFGGSGGTSTYACGYSSYGGTNYAHPSAIAFTPYVGRTNGGPSSGAPEFVPANPSWSSVIPSTVGDGGGGDPGGSAGTPGILIVRYSLSYID